jgi:RimJ/RimL family protein N-acetyltransferase
VTPRSSLRGCRPRRDEPLEYRALRARAPRGHRRPVDRSVEIGYEIAPQWRGRGYATVAAAALVQQALAGGAVDVVTWS